MIKPENYSFFEVSFRNTNRWPTRFGARGRVFPDVQNKRMATEQESRTSFHFQ
jgi:hypothetical protein